MAQEAVFFKLLDNLSGLADVNEVLNMKLLVSETPVSKRKRENSETLRQLFDLLLQRELIEIGDIDKVEFYMTKVFHASINKEIVSSFISEYRSMVNGGDQTQVQIEDTSVQKLGIKSMSIAATTTRSNGTSSTTEPASVLVNYGAQGDKGSLSTQELACDLNVPSRFISAFNFVSERISQDWKIFVRFGFNDGVGSKIDDIDNQDISTRKKAKQAFVLWYNYNLQHSQPTLTEFRTILRKIQRADIADDLKIYLSQNKS